MHRPLFILCLLLSAWSLQNCGKPEPDPLEHRRAMWQADIAALDESLALLAMALRTDASDSICRTAFHLARSRYKGREFLWEYAFPATARMLNGPVADEVERDDEATVIPAAGLQVLETLLFPSVSGDLDRRVDLVEAMRRALAKVSEAGNFEPVGTSLIHRPLAFTDSSLLDAVRLEIYRLGSLGLTGFDSPVALQSLPETLAALLGMESWLAAAFPDPANPVAAGRKAAIAFDSLRKALQSAAAASTGDFAAFDRLAFLTGYLNPAYAALARFQSAAGIPLPREARAFDPAASDMYSAAAWNPDFFGASFAPRQEGSASPAFSTSGMAHLGRRLFSDPSLSGDGTRSCASCHLPEMAFTDGLRRSPALPGRKPIARNSPSLLHAAFQQGSFLDLRAESLEDQAGMVIHNPSEMGGSLDSAAARLSGNHDYAAEFQRAFAADPDIDRDSPVTPLRIRRALAAYVRSLAPFDSPWDRHMRGDAGALSAEARHGFNVFMGKAKCATCHFPPLFNGTVPPRFLETDLEVLGVPAEAPPARAALDPDSGRMAVDNSPLSRGAFRTPTVRNADLTAPYMHNGVFATLDEVVEFYDEGGGAGRGLAVPNQTLPADTLKLTVEEEQALIAFMKSLTDTAGTTARAAPAPPHTAAGGSRSH